MKIRKLEETVRKSGNTFFLIDRTDKVALYQANKPSTGFEVFKIKMGDSKKLEKFNGKPQYHDFYERYPGDEDFGKTAWHFSTLERARERFDYERNQLVDTECGDCYCRQAFS